jgi:serine/threonine protein phosphatase PrpC
VLASIIGTRIVGASIGDCGQFRKPLLGSGSFVAVPFGAELNGATLLLASDGLLKHAPHERILSLMREWELQSAAVRLSELPRLRSGTLPDDVAVVLCRASTR